MSGNQAWFGPESRGVVDPVVDVAAAELVPVVKIG